MDLIPGLPNDVARECLIRVPYNKFSNVASTCRDWKAEILLPEFFHHRKAVGCSRSVVVMTQARHEPNKNFASLKFLAMPIYRLVLCEPDTGNWSELPPVPGFSNGLPLFCQVVGVGLDLVALGGFDPETFEVLNCVYIYNFVSAKWRRGEDMPGVRRSFFGCASDSHRMVFVAGGHDVEKNGLKSGMTYDVATNEWIPLPDMATERDECKGIFHLGRFHVIGGYSTHQQGQFESGAESFDVASWQWSPVEENFLGSGICPRTCVAGNGKMYMRRGGGVAVQEGGTWETVAELPAELQDIAQMTTWQDKMLVIGSASFGGPHVAYVLSLDSYKWTKMEVVEEHCGHVQSSCWLEL